MIDAEVMRLRKLRNAALRARALAQALGSDSSDDRVFAESAVISWNLSRIASGRLRAHPYLKYQQGPSQLRELTDRAVASMVALAARRRGRCFSVYAAELQSISREVADARALTLSPDLSDALGRAQLQLGRLAKEIDAGAQREAGEGGMPRIKANARAPAGGSSLAGMDLQTETESPYLAI
jgi:hypothetical protein